MNIKFLIPVLSLLFLNISCLKEDDGIVSIPLVEGDEIKPEVGGPAQPNQIWIDLSTGEETSNRRTDWDFGFYCGEEFRVIINNSIMMAAAPIEGVTELSQVNSAMVEDLQDIVKVGTFQSENMQYLDDVKGNYLNNGTVIREISENDFENKVYLINLGYDLYTGDTLPSAAYTVGEERGWKKIKITREGHDAYRIQYAGLDETDINEYIIEKDASYNFKFFSMEDGNEHPVQPFKKDWDICFTVFTNEVFDNTGSSQGSYIFADFVTHNTLSGAGVYEVITSSATILDDYTNFSVEDINESLFIYNDHRAIGSNWRATFGGATVFGDRFYVIKDPNGINFKLRFLGMTLPINGENYRGHPHFVYEPL